jgi:VCBS repeat-containing protein
MFRRCLILALALTIPAQAAVIWLELGSSGSPAQNADGVTLTQSDIDGLVFAVKDVVDSVISTASPAGLDEAGPGHFIGVIHLGAISETAVTLQLRRLADKMFATVGAGTALLDDFEPQVDPAVYKIAAASLSWVFTNNVPVATPDSFTTDEDSPLIDSVTGTDGDGDPLTVSLLAGPVTLASDGSFTYAPPANFAGSASFTFTVNDGFQTSTSAVATIVVTPVNDPPIANAASVTTVEDNAYIGILSGSDIDSSISFSLVSGNATIAADGSFTYTPLANFAGPDSFIFRVSDGPLSDNATVAVTVTPVNDPPVADPAAFTTDEDLTLVAAVSGTDVDFDPLVYSLLSGPITLASDGSFSYVPPAEFAGTDSFVFRISDGSTSISATASIAVAAVDDTPIATPASFTTAEDTPFSDQVAATDVDSASLSFSLVSGLVTLASDGSFTYAPVADFAGTDSFTFRVSDDNTSSTAVASLTITPVNDAPIANPASFTILEDASLAATLTGSDVDSPITFHSSTATVASDGAFTYTPPAEFAGVDSFDFTVSDGVLTDGATVTITVLPVNDPPVAQAASITTVEDTPFSGQLAATDVESDPITFSAVAGSVTISSSGAYTYTPPADSSAPDSFIFRASDGNDSSSATVSVTITPVNDAPVALAKSITVIEDIPFTGTVAATDIDSAPLSYGAVSGNVLVHASGAFTYTPLPDSNAPDSFIFSASDGALSDSATVSVTITPVNDAPLAQPDAFTTAEDSALFASVVASDVDSPFISYFLVSTVSPVTLGADGAFTYLPPADFFGSDSFTYRASDGSAASTATVSLTVTPVNDPPGATDDSFTVVEGNTLTGAVLGNDLDPDGDALSAILVGNVSHGLLSLASNGTFTYAPSANFFGTERFTYRASDGLANSAIAEVFIEVYEFNDRPVASPDFYVTDEDTTLLVSAAAGVLANDFDLETADLSMTLVSGVSHGSISFTADGAFTYSPLPDYAGTDVFTYKASDTFLSSVVTTAHITINPINDPPTAAAATFSTLEDALLTGTLNASDPESSALSFSLISGANVTVAADGSFSYAPPADFHGAASFSFRASDGAANSAPASVSITVLPVNDPPVAQAGAYTIAEDSALLSSVTATDTESDPLTFSLLSGPVTLAANGAFTYLPPANFHGSASFSYRVSDGPASSSASVSLTVTPRNDAPIAKAASFTTLEDSVLTGTVTGSDVDLDPLAFGLVTGANVTLAGDGSFTYAPPANFAGQASFSFRANDGITNSAPGTISIEVLAVNDPPLAQSAAFVLAEDSSLVAQLSASDTEDDPLSFSLLSGPVTVAASGSFSYLPAANFHGSDSFTFQVSDGEASSSATVTLTVTPVNDAVSVTADNFTLDEDAFITGNVATNDSDPDGDAFVIALVANPAKGALSLLSTGAFTYTPDPDFAGADSFSYKANDGQVDSPSVLVSLSIEPINDPPVASPGTFFTDEDVPLLAQLAASDLEGSALSFSLVSGENLTLAADGSFTYTPLADFAGSDSFSFRVSDGDATDVATATINIAPINDAPLGVADSFTLAEDGALIADVLANDEDADLDPLTAILLATPTSGQLNLAAGGAFTYTPDADFAGSDGFTYKANDGAAESLITQVTLVVIGDNDPPRPKPDSYATAEDTPLFGASVLANDSDPDDDALTAVLISGNVTLASDGSFSYQPPPNFHGSDSFTYAADDGTLSTTTTVTINIASVNDVPVGFADSYTTQEDSLLTGNVITNDIDLDGETLRAQLTSGTSNGQLTLSSSGAFTYLPNQDYVGPDSFRYRAADSVTVSSNVVVSITVLGANDPPIALADTYATPEDTPLIVGAAAGLLNNDSDADGNALTASLVSGAATIAADGAFTFIPDSNSTATASFTYAVSDGQASTTAVVSIAITPVNDPPVAQAASFSVLEDGQLTGQVTAIDVELDPLTYTLISGPVSFAADGSFSYTPPANFNGAVTFSFRASDGVADSAIAQVTISVVAVNDPPSAQPDSYSTAEDTSLAVAASVGVRANDSDPDLEPLVVSLATAPVLGQLSLGTDGAFSYTPNANANGADSFVYRLSDGALSDTSVVSLTITSVNDPPVASAASFTGLEDMPLTGQLAGIDIEASPLSFTFVSGVAITLSSSGAFTYNPPPNFHGPASFKFRARHGKPRCSGPERPAGGQSRQFHRLRRQRRQSSRPARQRQRHRRRFAQSRWRPIQLHAARQLPWQRQLLLHAHRRHRLRHRQHQHHRLAGQRRAERQRRQL